MGKAVYVVRIIVYLWAIKNKYHDK